MIAIIPSAERYHADFGWLSTRWHFSFSDYYDPRNMGWGTLRVFNDDVIQGGGGFGMHPHQDMEIVTYVLDGELEHRDSLNHRGVIHPGEVQVMSAGKGIVHAEYNHSADRPVHLLQIWITPRHKNLPPRWEQRQFTPDQRRNRLFPVVSSGQIPDTLAIDQDAAIYVSSLDAGQSVTHTSTPGRKAYLFAISGQLTVNGQSLSPGDQARIDNEPSLDIRADSPSELILLDVPNR
jgi:quercetin 2,3-dioxygenase